MANTDLSKFTKAASKIANDLVEKFSSKYSRQDYTQPQLVVANCLREWMGTTYREIVDWLEEMPRICRIMDLDDIPHFTTIQKAFAGFSCHLYRVLLKRIRSSLQGSGLVGIDATGFNRTHASRYYTKRTDLKIGSLKVTLAVDLEDLTVVDVHMTTTRKHDTKIGPKLVKRLAEYRPQEEIKVLAADKGYDDSSFREDLREKDIRPLIKHREFSVQDKAANARIDDDLYNQRNKVETVNSSIKKMFGDDLSSREWPTQFRELLQIILLYNIDRLMKLGEELPC